MTEEEQNKKKRKHIPLTREEYLTFFFFPYIKLQHRMYWKSFTKNFNKLEDKRFIEHGFDTKIQQAKSTRALGIVFYAILLFIAIILIQYFNLV